MFDVPDASRIFADFQARPALVIPYFDPFGEPVPFMRDGEELPFCRIRYLDQQDSKGFVAKKAQRYTQPRRSGVHAYFAPGIDWPKMLDDPEEPLIITEGEKKALAGVVAGFPVIALGGVFNFTAEGVLLLELERIKWRGRDVYLVFDSDAAANPHIMAAEARLVDELQRKRGARCFLVRLPANDDNKVGLDDFLVAHGPTGLVQMLQGALSLGALDAKVVALNSSVAWISRENMIYDLGEGIFIPKDSFANAPGYSSIKHITVDPNQRSKPKVISVAKTWLTHPHAQRFSEILFRPGEGPTVKGEEGGTALNLWRGWEPEAGNVQPFLDLNEFLFSKLPPVLRDFPLKLMAYKVQNPQEKIAIALVLIGTQGSGKSLWADCLHDALAPYSTTVSGKSFDSEFQSWLEKSLLAVIHEADAEAMQRGKNVLKSLISDLRRPMNEKYRPIRQINSYTQYILTANSRAVGSFDADDRRMFVVDCPQKRPKAFYAPIWSWRKTGGGRALLHYLLNYDLQGWTPPIEAPLTAEKYMAFMESLTPVQRLATEMKTADHHTIKMWIDQAVAWAAEAELSSSQLAINQARAIVNSMKHMQIRPWYTPEELAMLFPNLIESFQGVRYRRSTPAGLISRELRDAGVPYLVNKDDPRGFHHKGLLRQYLVVGDFEEWGQPIRQSDFDRLMQQWPEYQMLRGGPRR